MTRFVSFAAVASVPFHGYVTALSLGLTKRTPSLDVAYIRPLMCSFHGFSPWLCDCQDGCGLIPPTKALYHIRNTRCSGSQRTVG